MQLFLMIYGGLALIFFIFFEVYSIVQCRDANRMFRIPIYQCNHLRTIAGAILFPIVILIIAIGVITEIILNRRQ